MLLRVSSRRYKGGYGNPNERILQLVVSINRSAVQSSGCLEVAEEEETAQEDLADPPTASGAEPGEFPIRDGRFVW